MIKNLVLSSGSVKGLSFIGAYKILETNNLLDNIENILGSSIGTVFGLCLCLAYTSQELENIFKSIDLNIFNDLSYDELVGFLSNYGITSCYKLVKILKAFIKAKLKKEDCTFKELFEYSDKNLIINSVCINEQKLYYFEHEQYPDLSVLTAIEMSTAIPWLIKPIVFNDRLFVDGALMNGYPINYFKKEIDKTLGIVLLEENYKDIKTINSLEQYSLSIVMCQTMHQKKKMYEKYKNNSILISSDSNLNNFSFKKGDKEGLIDNGYKCTIDYFKNGFFDKFINEIDTDNNEKELLEDNLLDEKLSDNNDSSINDKKDIKEDKIINKEDLSIEKD